MERNKESIGTRTLKGKGWYREKIVELVEKNENLDYLEFIYNMMIAFKEKWGI